MTVEEICTYLNHFPPDTEVLCDNQFHMGDYHQGTYISGRATGKIVGHYQNKLKPHLISINLNTGEKE